jgi:hypothetical protein
MATIRYNITAGDPPFIAELYRGAVLVDTKVWNSKRQFHFTNVPNGNYTVIVSDTVGCSSQFDAVVACDATTTTTT